MKKGKKILLRIGGIIWILYSIYFVGWGFIVDNGIYPYEYQINEERNEISFSIASAYSMGNTRGYRKVKDGKKLSLIFYNCFWWLNSSFWKITEITLPLDAEINEICFGDHRCYCVKNWISWLWDCQWIKEKK